MNAEERKWREEREKVLDEWSEIELKFREGTPVRIAVQRESVDIEETSEKQTVIGSQPTNWAEIHGSEDELVNRLLNEDYETEKSGVIASLPESDSSSYSVNSLMLRCICRPVESLSTDQMRQEKILLLAMSRKTYNGKSPVHWQMLFEFYRSIASHALDDAALAAECPATGAHWQIVGFQGTRPSTDFRGVGLLGLLQLYCLTTGMQEDRLKQMVKLSRNEPNDFPFAVVGINFTALLLSKLRTDELNAMANASGGVLRALNTLYRGCFTQFTTQWKDNSCSITDFQTVLNGVHGTLRKDPWKFMK